MSKQQNLKKTWIVGSARVTTTFNAPGNLTVPYGQFVGSLRGRGGSGNVPSATAYSITYATNYNVAYPIANRPEASRPATAWTTNYNTNYNVAYPIANRPESGRPINAWTTNYNIAYPIANQPESGRPVNSWAVYYNVSVEVANQPIVGYNPRFQTDWNVFARYYSKYPFTSGSIYSNFNSANLNCPSPRFNIIQQPPLYAEDFATYTCYPYGNNANYTTNYNVNYPFDSEVPTAWNITYNTNYNVAYPIANQPATAWNITYNTNYNVAYPIANQPIATQPATAFTILYNTNYNVAYPIANQPETGRPINAYVPGNTGAPITLLGVTFPGGPIDTSGFPAGTPGTATFVNKTVVAYDNWPQTGSLSVTVPSGGQITAQFE